MLRRPAPSEGASGVAVASLRGPYDTHPSPPQPCASVKNSPLLRSEGWNSDLSVKCLTLNTINTWGWMLLCCGAVLRTVQCLVPSRALDANNIPLLWQSQLSPDMAQWPLGIKSRLAGNCWSMSTMGILFFLLIGLSLCVNFGHWDPVGEFSRGILEKVSSFLNKRHERQMVIFTLQDVVTSGGVLCTQTEVHLELWYLSCDWHLRAWPEVQPK